jgi:hypothetical protein
MSGSRFNTPQFRSPFAQLYHLLPKPIPISSTQSWNNDIRSLATKLHISQPNAHIKILKNCGLLLTYGDEKICNEKLNFNLDLAKPEIEGGVLVVLHQPHPTPFSTKR